MSRPPLNPEKTAAGIAIDPRTLERVIPESRRPDGSIRKQIKIRPGFTPQEDVKRFRGTKQAQMDANALPKGHILGWTPPSSTQQPAKPMSKSAKKNAKRKEKRLEAHNQKVKDNWDDEDEDDGPAPSISDSKTDSAVPPKSDTESTAAAATSSTDKSSTPATTHDLEAKMEKLDVN